MEYGIANEMKQYESNYKARSILGEMDDASSKKKTPFGNSSRN